MTSQREKDYRAWLKLPPPEDDSRPALFCDGAEYGRRDLTKLERLLRAGWAVEYEDMFDEVYIYLPGDGSPDEDSYSGATLAEALALVPE